MELETSASTSAPPQRCSDAGIRQLLGDLAEEERHHELLAEQIAAERLPADVRAQEDATRRRLFVLQVVQPGLAGLMDGSVSTLAPLFAAAFATRDSWDAFLVGLAASSAPASAWASPRRCPTTAA